MRCYQVDPIAARHDAQQRHQVGGVPRRRACEAGEAGSRGQQEPQEEQEQQERREQEARREATEDGGRAHG